MNSGFINRLWLLAWMFGICCSTSRKDLVGENQQVRYLALGDSYTIGESVDPKNRYPVLLTTYLRDQQVWIQDPQIIAKTRWTTRDLAQAINDANLNSQTFDLVSLLIGVNDQYQSKPFADYDPNFRKLLKEAISLAGGQHQNVFVISIPDYAYTPFGQKKDPVKITRELNAYNEVNRKIAREYGITYFDITPASRQGLKRPELVAQDGLHPSGTMYMEWVEMMASDIRKKLEIKSRK